MNEGAESHWFSGTSQEPMGLKGMVGVGGGSHKKKKKKRLSDRTIIICDVKVGYCKFMGGGGYDCC